MRELVEQIDAHAEMIRTKATSNPPIDGLLGEDVHPKPPIPKHHSSEMTSET